MPYCSNVIVPPQQTSDRSSQAGVVVVPLSFAPVRVRARAMAILVSVFPLPVSFSLSILTVPARVMSGRASSFPEKHRERSHYMLALLIQMLFDRALILTDIAQHFWIWTWEQQDREKLIITMKRLCMCSDTYFRGFYFIKMSDSFLSNFSQITVSTICLSTLIKGDFTTLTHV